MEKEGVWLPGKQARVLTQKLKWVEMASRIPHTGYKGPSIIKEIIFGISLGLFAGGMWKMSHWNDQRKTKEFYDLLERGDISVVVEED